MLAARSGAVAAVSDCRQFIRLQRSSQWRSARHCSCQVRASSSTASESESERIAAVRVETTRRITQLGRSGKPREAMLQLAEMARLGVQPDSIAATALLDACARNKKMDMASSVFEELFSDLLRPDDVTFAVLVRGYGEADPPQWTAISGLLGMMDSRFQLKPSTAVYNSLLDICARTKDDERGYEVIDRMHRSDVATDARTMDAVRSRKSLRSHLKRVFGEDLSIPNTKR